MSQRASALQSLLALVQQNRRGPQRVVPAQQQLLAASGDDRPVVSRSTVSLDRPAPAAVSLVAVAQPVPQTKEQTLRRLLAQVQQAPRRK